MKKLIFLITILIASVFNFTTEAGAVSHSYINEDASAYAGSITGHGATYGYYNRQYNTVAVHKKSNNTPYIPFGTVITLNTSLYLTVILVKHHFLLPILVQEQVVVLIGSIFTMGWILQQIGQMHFCLV